VVVAFASIGRIIGLARHGVMADHSGDTAAR
jgi:hypothetical protein